MAKLTARRFRVIGALPEGWRELFRDRLTELAFKAPLKQGKEEVEGWTVPDRILDADFEDLNRWLVGDYLRLSLRVDKKTLPAKLFAATVKDAAERWAADKGVERCPASIKKELKEELEDRWFARALPSAKVITATWSISEGTVLVETLSAPALERFKKRFHRTFGMKLVDWSPLDWVDTFTAGDLLTSSPGSVSSTTHAPAPGPVPTRDEGQPILPHLAGEFLTWLWWRSDTGKTFDLGGDVGPVELWVDERIVFREEGDNKAVAVLVGDPAQALEARAALVGGRVVQDIRLGMRRDDREFVFTLKGSALDLQSAKLPVVLAAGTEELVHDTQWLIAELWSVLGALYTAFAQARTSPEWGSTLWALRSWAQGEAGGEE